MNLPNWWCKFQKGDRIVCVDCPSTYINLTVGKEYIVESVEINRTIGEPIHQIGEEMMAKGHRLVELVLVKDNFGRIGRYYASRFKHGEQAFEMEIKSTKPMRLIELEEEEKGE